MKGKCLCEDIEFEISGCIPNLYQCHCSLCRKATGSASSSAFIVNKNNFRWLKGADKIASYIDDTGYRSDFCKKCGSPVPNNFKDKENVWVPAGLLEPDDAIRIVAHLFTGSRAAWDTGTEQGAVYPQGPENLQELLQLLHKR